MNKILRKYAVLLFGLAMMAPNTLQINADTNIQPSTDTYTGRGGSYDLSYILNNYNFFVKNNVSTGHTMGAAVAGGDCAIGNSAGIVANQPYKQTADSFIGGRLTAATPHMIQMNPIVTKLRMLMLCIWETPLDGVPGNLGMEEHTMMQNI